MRNRRMNELLSSLDIVTISIISEFKPSVHVKLSDVLENSTEDKYCLSRTACDGILRRAEKREKALPQQLVEALQSA